jgi:spore germination protein GerM
MMKNILIFFASKKRRRLLLLVLLCIGALAEYYYLNFSRKTFVFYRNDTGQIVVEDRMIKRSHSSEQNLTHYVEETLLGPVNPDLLPLFPRETRLQTLLYRNGVVFIDFSADAQLAPIEGGEILENFKTLYAGIMRNFQYVKDVQFFIEGNPAFYGVFEKDPLLKNF